MNPWDIPIFEIPVYRKTQAEFLEESQREKEKYTNHLDERTRKMEEKIWDSLPFPRWRYNDVIGWIRIYYHRGWVRADYYKSALRVSRTLKRKIFVCEYKLFSGDTELCDTFSEITYQIERIRNSERFKKYYIDTEIFKIVWPQINWEGILSNK